MTNYEKIKFLLEMWVYKGVEVATEKFNIKFTELYPAGISDDAWIWFHKDEINKLNITSITPIPNPPKLLPVGTKVRVFEEYNSRFLDKSKDYIIAGKIDKHATYYISDDWYMWDDEELVVPARAVVPVLE